MINMVNIHLSVEQIVTQIFNTHAQTKLDTKTWTLVKIYRYKCTHSESFVVLNRRLSGCELSLLKLIKVCFLRHTGGCCAHLCFVPQDLLSPLENCVTHRAAGSIKMPPADHYLLNKGFCVHNGVEATCFVLSIVYSLPLCI